MRINSVLLVPQKSKEDNNKISYPTLNWSNHCSVKEKSQGITYKKVI